MMGIVSQHGGVVFDLIGDELMAAFNVPNDVPFFPTDLAVHAAVEMQSLFKDLRQKWTLTEPRFKVGLGIGIHQGDVVLGNIGGAALIRYTIMGVVVNVAHRLVDLARDGEIYVSDDVYTKLGSLPETVEVAAIQGVQLKGIDEPQVVYKLSMPL